MADQQPGNGPAEPLSYDADVLADVRGAWDESVTETPAAEPEALAAPAEPVAPAEPKAEHPTDPTRYADGKFKPTKEDVPQQAANEQHAKAAREQQPQQQAQPPQPQPGAQALNLSVPPSSWPVAAKAEWDKLPEVVRAANIQREIDISNGQAKYETTKELIPFVELAHAQGQSPAEVIQRYMAAENYLRQNFIGGMLDIGRGMGYSPQQIAQAFAPYLGQSNGQTPEGYQPPSDPQQGGQTPGYDPAYLQQWINPLAQEVSSLRNYVQQQHQAEQNRQAVAINSVLQQFVADPAHRYFANVEDRIVQLFREGTIRRTGDHMADLKRAYKVACAENDEIDEAQFKERVARDQASKAQQQKEAAEKARHASRSITGSPSTGAARDFGDDDGSVEADVRRAVRAHAV